MESNRLPRQALPYKNVANIFIEFGHKQTNKSRTTI